MVIAKPLSSDQSAGNLDDKFSVKSVVSLMDLRLSAASWDDRYAQQDSSTSASRHPVVLNFIESFQRDPGRAVEYLMERSQLQDDHVALASLLFKSSELDKERLGKYLSAPTSNVLLEAFVPRFRFGGIQLLDGLRMYLLAIRLPPEANATQRLLEAFSKGWHDANSNVSWNLNLTNELVLATMQLNDALNPNTGFGYFGFANQVISVDDFCAAFGGKDTKRLVPRNVLEYLYMSIRRDKLVQAVRTEETGALREVLITPTKLPTRLTHNTWSERVYISIPQADARFGIKLHGEGLTFDPPYLDFTNSTEESFRIMGTAMGTKSMLFSRVGANA